MMATVRNLALAWFTTLGLVAFCLLCSPFPLFRLWSVQAMDTCMAALQSRGAELETERKKVQMGQTEWKRRLWQGKPEVSKSVLFKKSLDSVTRPLFFKVCVQVLLFRSSFFLSWEMDRVFSCSLPKAVSPFASFFFSVNKSQAVKAFPQFSFFLLSHQVFHFKPVFVGERQRNRSIIKKPEKNKRLLSSFRDPQFIPPAGRPFSRVLPSSGSFQLQNDNQRS